jgi:hypothetical protein
MNSRIVFSIPTRSPRFVSALIRRLPAAVP